MAISFERALGNHEQALFLRAARSRLLAQNIANSDTPGFKARDVDFARELRRIETGAGLLKVSHAAHMQPAGGRAAGRAQYRVPHQSSLDGNTVEAHLEQGRFADNALRYQTTLRFLDSKFKGLMLALKGQ